jgi:hypothetical protein
VLTAIVDLYLPPAGSNDPRSSVPPAQLRMTQQAGRQWTFSALRKRQRSTISSAQQRVEADGQGGVHEAEVAGRALAGWRPTRSIASAAMFDGDAHVWNLGSAAPSSCWSKTCSGRSRGRTVSQAVAENNSHIGHTSEPIFATLPSVLALSVIVCHCLFENEVVSHGSPLAPDLWRNVLGAGARRSCQSR